MIENGVKKKCLPSKVLIKGSHERGKAPSKPDTSPSCKEYIPISWRGGQRG